ncbi:MAG: hypothetical protein ACRDTJ_23630 [Pseudonocardiaceae bacterium]
MSVIKTCVYENSELMAPTDAEIDATFTSAGGYPAFDSGCYHKFVINAFGTSYGQAEARMMEKMRRFYGITNAVAGFSTLRLNKTTDIIRFNGNHVITYEIVYVVEEPTRTAVNSEPTGTHSSARMRPRARERRPVTV